MLEKVVKNARLDCSAAEIRGMMTTAQVDETELFSVYISHPDPEMAAKIANAVDHVRRQHRLHLGPGLDLFAHELLAQHQRRAVAQLDRLRLRGQVVGRAVKVRHTANAFHLAHRCERADVEPQRDGAVVVRLALAADMDLRACQAQRRAHRRLALLFGKSV